MDEMSHHGQLPSVLAKGAQQGGGEQFELAEDLPGEEVSLHSESRTLLPPSLLWCLWISSPHRIRTQLPRDTRAGTEGFSCRLYDSSQTSLSMWREIPGKERPLLAFRQVTSLLSLLLSLLGRAVLEKSLTAAHKTLPAARSLWL